METRSPLTELSAPQELARFAELQAMLPDVWNGIQSSPAWTHTSVVVPSLSFDQEELAKIQGAAFYEERLLFALMRLRHPGAHVIYVTAQPIHPDIVDYYLHLLVGVPASHARRRLAFFCVYDASAKPLSQKILERPRLVRRIREWLGPSARAYLTCFNSSVWERQLAVALGIPLNGLDPALLEHGTKTGSRRVFREAGIQLPEGIEALHEREEIVEALAELAGRRPGLRRAVLKLDAGFSGAGNALFTYPEDLPAAGAGRRRAIDRALDRLDWSAEAEHTSRYFRKFAEMGGIVEEFLEAPEVRSPSAQARVLPSGECEIISTHEQLLGGKTGQAYVGCRFPADGAYRLRLQAAARDVGRLLAERGVVSRFALDFLATRSGPAEPWDLHAIEINLRMGGTTHPFMALRFLTGGGLEEETGRFLSPRGQEKHYVATDGLVAPAYRGLLPEDLIEMVSSHGLHFRPSTETGVIFHMIGALSEFGRVGVTSFGNDADEARRIYEWTVQVLDRETGATRGGHMELMVEPSLPAME